MPVIGTLIHILSGSVKARSASQHTFPDFLLTFLPGENFIFCNVTIEGDNRELCQFCQLVQLGEEGSEHRVTNRARLVNADCNLCLTSLLTSRVDVRVALVDALDGGATICLLACLDEVAKNISPVYLSRQQSVCNVLATITAHCTPVASLASFFSRLTDTFL